MNELAELRKIKFHVSGNTMKILKQIIFSIVVAAATLNLAESANSSKYYDVLFVNKLNKIIFPKKLFYFYSLFSPFQLRIVDATNTFTPDVSLTDQPPEDRLNTGEVEKVKWLQILNNCCFKTKTHVEFTYFFFALRSL